MEVKRTNMNLPGSRLQRLLVAFLGGVVLLDLFLTQDDFVFRVVIGLLFLAMAAWPNRIFWIVSVVVGPTWGLIYGLYKGDGLTIALMVIVTTINLTTVVRAEYKRRLRSRLGL